MTPDRNIYVLGGYCIVTNLASCSLTKKATTPLKIILASRWFWVEMMGIGGSMSVRSEKLRKQCFCFAPGPIH